MKAEENLIDNWLKESVWREILYRVGLWSLITVVVFYISLKDPTFVLIKYVTPFVTKMVDQLNFAWAFLYIPVVISFFFKDMGYMKPAKWGDGSIRFKAGMIIKKVTCELLLWTGGITTSLVIMIVTSFPVIIFNDNNTTLQDYTLTGFLIFFFSLFMCFTLFLYYYLRIDKPAIYSLTNSFILTKLCYVLLFLMSGFMIVWMRV